MVYIVLALLLVIIALIYKFAMHPYDTFKDRGIAYEKPKLILGNLSLKVILGQAPFLRMLIENYQKFKHFKVYGFYNLREPLFVLHDVELIKKVGIQEFDSFTNHRLLEPESCQTLLSKSLTALKDDKWREMRNTLTPSFTGSKLKAMFEMINECSLEGVRYIENELRSSGNSEIELEMKDYFGRNATDVIASTAFGIKVNSFVQKRNQFYVIGQSMVKFTYVAMLKVLLYGLMPKVMKLLRVQIFDTKKINYFNSLVFDAIKYRTEHNIIRNDMIHLLMEAKRQFEQQKEHNILENSTERAEFTDDDLLAQCLLFFFVGFETISVSLSFLTYELCMHPEVQDQLYEEIAAVEQELQGQPLSFNMLSKMKYMDMVISELLRLWPPAFSLDRVCGKDIDIYDDEKQLLCRFKKGDIVVVPLIALHRDPQNFTEPDKFKPERFSEQQKMNIKPFTYLPFGVGPRSCIGNRMALIQVKSMIYYMVSTFKLLPAKKTVKNMMNNLNGFENLPKEKFWIKFVPRNSH